MIKSASMGALSLLIASTSFANLEVFLAPAERTDTIKKDEFYNYLEETYRIPSLNSAVAAAQYERALALVLAGYNELKAGTDEKKALVSYLLMKTGRPLTAFNQLVEVSLPESLPTALKKSVHSAIEENGDSVTAQMDQLSDTWMQAWLKTNKNDYVKTAGVKGQKFKFVQMWKEISWALRNDDLQMSTQKLNAALNDPSLSSVQKDLINLTIARLLYGANYLEPSLKFYDQISSQSPFYLLSKEERAWIYLRKGQYADVMSQISPSLMTDLATQMSPEAFVLEALTQLRLCRYKETVQSVNRFKTVYKARKSQLEEARTSSSLAQQGVESRKLVPRDSALDSRLEEIKALHSALKKEGASLAEFKPKISNLAPEFADSGTQISNLIARNSEAQSKMNNAFKARIDELIQNELSEIEGAVAKIQIVEAELLNRSLALGNNLPVEPKNKKVSNLTPNSSSQLVFDREKQIWLDELFDVQFEVGDACIR